MRPIVIYVREEDDEVKLTRAGLESIIEKAYIQGLKDAESKNELSNAPIACTTTTEKPPTREWTGTW